MSDFSLDRLAAFPRARQGYARGPVDDYVANVQRAVEVLRHDNAALAGQLQRLTEQMRETESKYERIRTARLDERAQDILGEAEQRAAAIVAESERAAAEIVRRAHREAEVAMERSRQELAWARRQLVAERGLMAREQVAAQREEMPAPAQARGERGAEAPGSGTGSAAAAPPEPATHQLG